MADTSVLKAHPDPGRCNVGLFIERRTVHMGLDQCPSGPFVLPDWISWFPQVLRRPGVGRVSIAMARHIVGMSGPKGQSDG